MSTDPELAGRLLENFVVSEIRKQIAWAGRQVSARHFRSAAGREVDIVLADRSGDLVGIEINLAAFAHRRYVFRPQGPAGVGR